MFHIIKQQIMIVSITITITTYSMKQPGYYIQTNDHHITHLSEKNIKHIVLLHELAQQRYKSNQESISKPLQFAAINRHQLCLLSDGISASKDPKNFSNFYNTLTEDAVGDLLNTASATATAKILCLMASRIFPPEVQKLIIAYDKKEHDTADVKHALLTKSGPQKYATYTVPTDELNAIRWHPKVIHFLSWEKDHIVVRDSNTAAILQTFEIGEAGWAKLDSSPVLEYTTDGAFIVSKKHIEHYGRKTTIWDGTTIGKKIKTFASKYPSLTDFSPNNEQFILATEQKIILWNIKTNESVEKECSLLNAILFHPIIGRGFLTAGKGMKDRNVTWRDETGNIVQQLSTHDNNAVCADISSDGTRIAIGHMDDGQPGRCILRDGITREKIATLKALGSIGISTKKLNPVILLFSPNNKYLITATHGYVPDTSKLIVWDAKNGKLLHTITVDNIIKKLLFSSDSSLLFTSDNDQTIVYNGKTFKRLFQINEKLEDCTLNGSRFITREVNRYVNKPNAVNVWKLISDKIQNILDNQESDMFYNYRFNKLCKKLGLLKKQSSL